MFQFIQSFANYIRDFLGVKNGTKFRQRENYLILIRSIQMFANDGNVKLF